MQTCTCDTPLILKVKYKSKKSEKKELHCCIKVIVSGRLLALITLVFFFFNTLFEFSKNVLNIYYLFIIKIIFN